MNDQATNERPRRGALLAVVLSALAAAIALPAGVALAGGGDGNSGSSGTTFEHVQEEQAPDDGAPQRPEGEQPPEGRQRPDGHPCPEDQQGSEGDSSSATAFPEV